MARDAEVVEMFIDESLEAVQRMERLLIAAEQGSAAPDLVATLFRDLHTLKGTAGFLEYERVRTLAHAAEDLLARLRDGAQAVAVEHYACLVETNQLLAELLTQVRATGEEGDVAVAPLVQRLGALAAPRPAPDVAAALPSGRLGDILLAQQAITREQLDAALALQARAQPSSPRSDAVDTTVRVPVAVLDRLMDLMGELVVARNQVLPIVRRSGDGQAGLRLSLVTADLQEQIMKTRLQPIERVFEKIPGMLRQLCQQTGKQARTVIDGTHTEIDKTLIEALREPIIHIIRNVADHALESPAERRAAGKPEQGTVAVRARPEGGRVTLEIEDDGRGIDPVVLRAHAVKRGLLPAADAARLSDRDALELVFRAGFSTATKVTDLSGRGVGMDVVRTQVERAGGHVELESVVGRGTLVRITMPLTLAILPTLLVGCGAQVFAVPQLNLVELVYFDAEQPHVEIETVGGAEIFRLRGEILPVVRLDRVLGLPPPVAPPGDTSIVVVSIGARRYGLVVDRIDDTEEVVIKPLNEALKRIGCFAGATVLGDGRIALILEMGGVAARAGLDLSRVVAPAPVEACPAPASGRQRCVVFRAGADVQCAVPLAAVTRLEHVATERIERVGDREIVQHRGRVVPILRPEDALAIGPRAPAGPQQALLLVDCGSPVALAVERIVDIAELDLSAESLAQGHTLALGRVTQLVDVQRLVRQLAPQAVAAPRSLAERAA